MVRHRTRDSLAKNNANTDESVAIQAYVWSGMLYPENTSSFEAQLPKPTFEPVAAVAPTLYEVGYLAS